MDIKGIKTRLKAKGYFDERLTFIIHLHYISGCRVSELLSLRGDHIISDSEIFLPGLKRSEDRVITINGYENFLELHRGGKYQLFSDISRFFLYRLYKKLDISYSSKNSTKKSVTHAFRHMKIERLKKSGISLKNTASHMGHKSEQSTERYGEEKK